MTWRGLIDAGYRDLAGAISLYVGSIRRARRLARIPEPGTLPTDVFERWDEDRVIGEIRDRHRNGKPLSAAKVPNKLYLAANRHCGGWQAAIEMAGLDYDYVRLSHRPGRERTCLPGSSARRTSVHAIVTPHRCICSLHESKTRS